MCMHVVESLCGDKDVIGLKQNVPQVILNRPLKTISPSLLLIRHPCSEVRFKVPAHKTSKVFKLNKQKLHNWQPIGISSNVLCFPVSGLPLS